MLHNLFQVHNLDPLWADLLVQALQKNTLPHFLILSSSKKDAVDVIAKKIAQLYLSTEQSYHPDLLEFKTEGKLSLHPIATVERLRDELSYAPFASHRRAVVVYDGEKMLPSASNALLKTLEEPPHGTLLLFTTSHLERFIPTVRSRATIVRIAARSSESIKTGGSSFQLGEGVALLCREFCAAIAKRDDNAIQSALKALLEGVKVKVSVQAAAVSKGLNEQSEEKVSLENYLLQSVSREVLECIWQIGLASLSDVQVPRFYPFTVPQFTFQAAFGKCGVFTKALQAIEKGASLESALYILLLRSV